MNWLPTLPTDNFYKYLALNGLWLVYGVIALIVFLEYQNFKHEEFNKKNSWLYSKQTAVQKFKARIDSINKGKLLENKVDSISDRVKPKEEIQMLTNAILINEVDIHELSLAVSQKPENLTPLIEYFPTERLLISLLTFGTFLATYGFFKWRKMQKIADAIQRYEMEIKHSQALQAKRNQYKRKM